MNEISVVIPVLNEDSLIEELIKRVTENVRLITQNYEVIIIDDGSTDKTWELIESKAKQDHRIRGIKLSRNFGQHYAITAGLYNSNGEWVVVMDGDLQDRPEVIKDLYSKAKSGFDVVFVSRKNRPENYFYIILQKIFYFMLRLLSGLNLDSSQANFSILNRKVVEAFKNFPENARFYGSTITWLGFKKSNVIADHGIRFAGKPAYTLRKRIKLAADIILSFSDRPLRASIYFGIIMSLASLIILSFVILRSIYNGFSVLGWASLVSLILFSTGIILIVTGIASIYLAEIFREVKKRPLYLIDKKI